MHLRYTDIVLSIHCGCRSQMEKEEEDLLSLELKIRMADVFTHDMLSSLIMNKKWLISALILPELKMQPKLYLSFLKQQRVKGSPIIHATWKFNAFL